MRTATLDYLMLAGLFTLWTGCQPWRANDAVPARAGENCSANVQCGAGLLCSRSGTCEAAGSTGTLGNGASCQEDTECQSDFVCNSRGQCRRPQSLVEDETCLATADCGAELVCSHEGLCAVGGQQGTAADGDDCSSEADCRLGLTCGIDGACTPRLTWQSGVCGQSSDSNTPGIRFVIPDLDTPVDFFSLPYPNDIRRQQTITDLSGFPGRDSFPIPAELLNQYISVNEQPRYGFGLNETVYFRFDGRIDYDTLEFGGIDKNFSFVNISPESRRYGLPPRSRFYATGSGDKYICPNWLGIRPSEGSPLTPLTTYAVIFRKGITDTNGVQLEPSVDFQRVVNDTPPTNATQLRAWEAYAPLRLFLAEKEIPIEDVIGATVFTTGNPVEQVLGAATTVNQRAVPSISDLTVCGNGVASPCGGEGRGCAPTQPGFTEFHGRISLPNVLVGEPPYTEGGGFAQFRGRRPTVQGISQACVSFAVPDGEMPQSGWPTIIFGHDMGGNFRTAIDSGLAAELTRNGWVVVGFDGLLHGSRFGTGTPPSMDELRQALQNLDNPRLLRDQGVQAVVDLHAVTAYLKTGQLQANSTRITFDETRLVFIGMGHGAELAIPFITNESALTAAIITGAGASMVDVFRTVNHDHPMAVETGYRLADPEMQAMHPALQLFQSWLDPRDGQNYGALLRNPQDEVPRKHLFYLHDIDATEIAPKNVEALVTSMRLQLVGERLADTPKIPDADLPAGEELRANVANSVTQGLKQFKRSGDQMNTSLLTTPAVQEDLIYFLQGLLSDGIPSIRQ